MSGSAWSPGRTSSCSAGTSSTRRSCAAIAEEAYAAGAHYVSAVYWDQHVKRSRMLHAPEDSLGFVPDWFERVVAEAVERRAALINVWGDPQPDLLDDIDPERLGRDHMPQTATLAAAIERGELAWTVVPDRAPAWRRRCSASPTWSGCGR